MTEAKAIRNSVEGRDTPRGPSATELHARTMEYGAFLARQRERIGRIERERECREGGDAA